MKIRLVLFFLLAAMSFSMAQTPVAEWLFDEPGNLTRAAIGDDLILIGTHEAVPGPG